MSTGTGAPAWIDLGVPDIEIAKKFYAEVFGWTFQDGGEQLGHYHQILFDGALVGGLMQNADPADNQRVFWETYFSTDDIEATLARVSERGGHVVVGAMPVADLGTMAIATSPSGAQFGLWQAGALKGFDASGAPGTAVWFDTPTTNLAADVDFYAAVLGWDVVYADGDSSSGFATVGPYESATIGLFDGTQMFPAGTPSIWRVFFEVADMDAAVAAIQRGGGRVTDGPEDVSEGSTRQLCATAVDPAGAVFLLMQTIKD